VPDLILMLAGVGALVNVVLLAVVLQRDPTSGISSRYAAFSGSLVVWGLAWVLQLSTSDRDLSTAYNVLASLGYCFSPALYLSLVQSFTGRLERNSSRIELVAVFALGVALLAIGWITGPLVIAPSPADLPMRLDHPLPLRNVYGFVMPVVFLLSFRHLAVAARDRPEPGSDGRFVGGGVRSIDLRTATLFLLGAMLPIAIAEFLKVFLPQEPMATQGFGFISAAFNATMAGLAVLTGGVLPMPIVRAAGAVGDSVGDALLVADRTLAIVYRNQVARHLMGEGGPKTLLDLFGDPEVAARVCDEASRGLRVSADVEVLRSDGTRVRVTTTITAHEHRPGEIDAFLLVARDLDDSDEQVLRLKDARDRLERQALTDPLTGLYNRRYLLERLREECIRSRRYKRPFGVALVDLDDFKPINDVFGHLAGDQVLVAVASGLRTALRESDLVARIGGDEFVAILLDITPANAGIAIDRIRDRLQAIRTEAVTEGVDASVGVAFWDPRESDNPEALLEKADMEMYRVKRLRKENRRTSRTLRVVSGAFRRPGPAGVPVKEPPSD
jgi:diguanylate cyclase (GGDEF)-like protein